MWTKKQPLSGVDGNINHHGNTNANIRIHRSRYRKMRSGRPHVFFVSRPTKGNSGSRPSSLSSIRMKPTQKDFWEDSPNIASVPSPHDPVHSETPGTENFTIRHDHLVVLPDREHFFQERFAALSHSAFRSSFRLKQKELQYIQDKGLETVVRHAQDFVRTRLASAKIPNDGKQTPMRGHPVFIAQHATGTCCRNCLRKWHGITPNTALSRQQQDYVVTMIMVWIQKQLNR